MARKKVSRNAPCPCGSGKKYKQCCWGKGFEWEQDEGGNLYRSTPISPEVAAILQGQRQKFLDRYGREPGPNDPVFFDLPHPEHVEHRMVEDMKAAGVNPTTRQNVTAAAVSQASHRLLTATIARFRPGATEIPGGS